MIVRVLNTHLCLAVLMLPAKVQEETLYRPPTEFNFWMENGWQANKSEKFNGEVCNFRGSFGAGRMFLLLHSCTRVEVGNDQQHKSSCRSSYVVLFFEKA